VTEHRGVQEARRVYTETVVAFTLSRLDQPLIASSMLQQTAKMAQ